MLKVACVAAIFAVAASRPQGGLDGFRRLGDPGDLDDLGNRDNHGAIGSIDYQFPYSSQSIKLHTDYQADEHKHYKPKEHNFYHHDVYRPPYDHHEEQKQHHLEAPKDQWRPIDTPMIHHNKHAKMPKMHHDEYYTDMPKKHYEKHHMPTMHHEKYHEESNIYHHDMPKYEEHHKKHEKHHEKHEEKHDKHHHTDDYHHPKYDYDYSVQDPRTGDYKTHRETRTGDIVHGFYTIHEADGTTRIVEYTADKDDGFKATVRHEGHVTHAA